MSCVWNIKPTFTTSNECVQMRDIQNLSVSKCVNEDVSPDLDPLNEMSGAPWLLSPSARSVKVIVL